MFSITLSEDMEETVSDDNIPWETLKNSTVLVTGATGLIGGALVRSLFAANIKHGLNVRIIAPGKNEEKAKPLIEECGAVFFKHNIREPVHLSDGIDYVFHAASITSSADMLHKPADVISTSVDGTRNVLELAREKQVKSLVYLSSMEVYGQIKGKVTESDLGYLNPASPRSSYPESKRLCELLCLAYHVQYGVPVKTARPAQTFGAGASFNDTRVFAQFARSAYKGEDIVLHTEGKSRGNYCYISDTVRALFTLLLKGENGQTYNIANPAASMTIREMAELVANEFGVKVRVEIPEESRNPGYAPDTGYILNIEKIKALGWTPRYGLSDMYRRMIADWHE